MQKTFCDRCHVEIVGRPEMNVHQDLAHWEVCNSCARMVHMVLQGGAVADWAPAPSPRDASATGATKRPTKEQLEDLVDTTPAGPDSFGLNGRFVADEVSRRWPGTLTPVESPVAWQNVRPTKEQLAELINDTWCDGGPHRHIGHVVVDAVDRRWPGVLAPGRKGG